MRRNAIKMEMAPSEALQGEELQPDFGEVRTVPLPFQPVLTNNSFPVQSPGVALSFTINGQKVPLRSDGTTEFKLNSNPPGAASGFTSVQHINTGMIINEPEQDTVPIISGVFSGQAAKKVLSDLSLNVNADCKPAEARKVLHHGRLSHIPPSKCGVCLSSFKVVHELRGFMCRCCPSIVQSLKGLRILRPDRSCRERRRKKKKSYGKVSQVQTHIPESKASPVRKPIERPDASPSEAVADPPMLRIKEEEDLPPLPESKLVTTVDDFYYHSHGGPSTDDQSLFRGTYRCILCSQRLSGNIELMSHMKEHATASSISKAIPSCPHCLRQFNSSLKLQRHLKDVHWRHPNPVKCQICERVFDSEQNFLVHMKRTHEPGEMPYVCQVCNFSSSFFSDVWFHFEEFHGNTKHLLCQFCLRVLHSGCCYQRHFLQHQKKSLLSCDRCRLHFLYVKDRTAHKQVHHGSHVKPSHLARLKPGTKVSVRVYSKEAGPGRTLQTEELYVEETVSFPEDSRSETESRLQCLQFKAEMESDDDSDPPPCCVECLNSIHDFTSHFPSVTRCSLCRFTTCCSRAFANHMINEHTCTKRRSQYCPVFQPRPRLRRKLICGVCSFESWRGDLMAEHLLEEQDHYCRAAPGSVDEQQQTEADRPLAASPEKFQSRGSFVPIELVSMVQTSSKLNISTHPSLSFASRAAMTIHFRDVRKPWRMQSDAQAGPCATPRTLLPYQLNVLLVSLCDGVSVAARIFSRLPGEIRKWTRERKEIMDLSKWKWDSEELASWLRSQWEQHLHVSQHVLLEKAKQMLGESSVHVERVGWAVGFLLHHNFVLHNSRKCLLPQSVRDQGQRFVQSLCAKIQGGALTPRCVGFMDEVSIFIRTGGKPRNLPSFHMLGLPGELPLFQVVVAGLADGTLLTPLLFFRGKHTALPKDFPCNVQLQAQPYGFIDYEEHLNIWTNKVWRPYVADKPQSLLMLDIHQGHMKDKFHQSLSDLSTEPILLPQSCSSLVQPLEVCVLPVLRHFLQARWTQLESQGGLESLTLDQLALTMSCWLSEVASILRAETHFLSRSFAEVCQLQPNPDSEEVSQLVRTLTAALCQETTSPD